LKWHEVMQDAEGEGLVAAQGAEMVAGPVKGTGIKRKGKNITTCGLTARRWFVNGAEKLK